MKLTQLLGRTWVLEGAELMGLYRLDGGQCILLDSGQRFERQDLADALAGAGLTPVGVLSSHIHTDHSINNGWLRDTYGCLAAAPAGEVHLSRSFGALRQYLYCYSDGAIARTFGDMVSPVDCPIPPEDGPFPFCGAEFSVVHTPGHSIDHLCLVTPDGVCFTGDAVLCGPGLEAKLPYAYDVGGMIRSTYLAQRIPCAAFLACHQGTGGPEGLAAAARDTRALLLDRAEQICALVDGPMSWQELFQAVNRQFALRSSRPVRTLLMERNLHSFVDFLLDAGALELSARDGLTYYAPGPAGLSGLRPQKEALL